jgi:spermidine/putrescine transport system substrate-binding protein
MNKILLPWRGIISIAIALVFAVGCSPTPAAEPPPTQQQLANTLTIHFWDGGMPQEILDAFTAEYGVKINYVPFADYEEAVQNIKTGKDLDLVFIGHYSVAGLTQASPPLITRLNQANIPNLRNISVNFRDLAFDPDNRFSVPYTWFASGLVVRADLFGKVPTSWNDLWTAQPFQAGLWVQQRDIISMGLRALGYSANSTDPQELEAALKHLIELKSRAVMLEQFDPWTSAGALNDGKVTIAYGWSFDAWTGRKLNPDIQFVIPEEGAIMGIENMVIPTKSKNQYTAETFINFMLRPEIAAKMTNLTFYAVTVDQAKNFIDPAILKDPIVYPTNAMLENATIVSALDPQAQALYDDIWARFMQAPGGTQP